MDVAYTGSEFTVGTGVLCGFTFVVVAVIGCVYIIVLHSEDVLTYAFLQRDVTTRRPNFESCSQAGGHKAMIIVVHALLGNA